MTRRFVLFGDTPTAGAPMGSVATDIAYLRSTQEGLGTLRGRIGYAPANWLVYVTGGLAVGKVSHSTAEVLAPGTTCLAPGAGCQNVSDRGKIKAGWTAGGGVEYAFAGGWSLALEYLYVDLGETTLRRPEAGGFFFIPSSSTFDDTSHVTRLKLNWRWGAALLNAPFVAR